MADVPPSLPRRQSVFDRIRGAMILLFIGVGAFALYYSLFFERKTSYLSGRNARMIALLGEQIRRSVDTTGRIVANAATMPEEELEPLYKYKRGLADHRQPQAIFDRIEIVNDPAVTGSYSRHSAALAGDSLKISFERTSDTKASPSTVDFMKEASREETGAVKKKTPGGKPAPRPFARASTDLKRLIDPMVKQAATDVFETVFIIDNKGNVIYQWTPQSAEDSDAELKIVQLRDVQVPRLFEGEETVQASDLMSASRQIAVRIGDRKYQLFSIPVRSSVHIEEDAHKSEDKPVEKPDAKAAQKADNQVPEDLWVVCGAISNADFRARSLAISTTLLCALGAVVLLMVFTWPFLKMALSSAHQKVTLVDVVLLGVSGVLAMSMACLIVLDVFTYRRLEGIADDHLRKFSDQIAANLEQEITTALNHLDAAQKWAEQKIAGGPIATRNANLLASADELGISKPFFQSFALIGKDERQQVKWVVDSGATPLVSVAMRNYYYAARHRGRDYLTWKNEGIAIESVRSINTGQPEVVFARGTDLLKTPGDNSKLRDLLPVIALSVPTAVSLIDPIVPEGFGFAIIDRTGRVLFHSISERNTVENFFAETDENPQLRSAVAARQNDTMHIRYLGEDYAAHIRPMEDLPWTIITFREQRGLRTLNTEALLITLIFLIALAVALVVFIALVLLARPRYRAEWLWPDPKRVGAYAELAAAYVFLLAVALVMLLSLRGAELLLFPFSFIPLVLVVTYLYLRPKLRGVKWLLFVAIDAVCVGLLIAQMWSASDRVSMPAVAASILLLLVGGAALFRPKETKAAERVRERQTALPLCYVWAAVLLLLLTSVVPTVAFFRAAYEMEMDSYIKRVQMKLAGDLQERWWKISAEYSDARGKGKLKYFGDRWREKSDIYFTGIFDTRVSFREDTPDRKAGAAGPVFPTAIGPVLPDRQEGSMNTRELVHDRAADDFWWWTRNGPRLDLFLKNRALRQHFEISSAVPQLLPTMSSMNIRNAMAATPLPAGPVALALLGILGVAFTIARFIARRVFLVDLVHPLSLSQGYIGLRQVICHPCDDDSALRLFRDFKRIDLATDEGLATARTAPQSFEGFEAAVFIDGVSYSFASGERSEILRALLDRLTRNSDRTVVIRPTALSVITSAFLQGDDREAWAKALAPFVWVNWSQLIPTSKKLTLSGSMAAYEDPEAAKKKRWSWRSLYALAGFDTYFEQFTDMRGAIRRALKKETDGDPYLQTLVTGMSADVTAPDQVLDEVGERAEEYYGALWATCSPHEQLVLMQLAQNGLVNGKTRKHVRRLLARGQLRRDPQLRMMNETFRRYVLAQSATSTLAAELEHNLGGDAWNRFRVPMFAGVAVVLLFFFVTQRQMFDSTIALVTGLAASLPAFIKMVSGFGGRGAKAD